MQVHACLLARHTGRPVKMVYKRTESFFGHVHRHPARIRYQHGATRDGRLVFVRGRILLDGGAYTSSSPAVVAYAVIPFGGVYTFGSHTVSLVAANPDWGLLYIFAIGSIATYGTVMAGWSSNNNWSLLGSLRASAQMISYEVTMGLSVVGIFTLNSLLSSAITAAPPTSAKDIQSTGLSSGLGTPLSSPKKMLSRTFIPSFSITQAAPCASCVVM